MPSFGAIVVVALPLLVGSNAAQAQPKPKGWSGWARCELEILGPGYTNRETHDWVVINAPVGRTTTGLWTVSGSGELATSAQLSRWNLSAAVSAGQSTDFLFQEAAGQVSIAQTSSPYASDGIAGYTIPSMGGMMPILANQHQWAFPAVSGLAARNELKGSSSRTGAPGWGYLRASGSQMVHRCMWWFMNNSVPAAPPSVTSQTFPPAPATPIASGVTIGGTPVFRKTLTGNFNYFDAQNDPQGISTFRWLRDGVPISGQTTRAYTLAHEDLGRMLSFEVTPVARSGPSPGSPVESPRVGPVTCPRASSALGSNTNSSGNPVSRSGPASEAIVDPCP